MLRQLTLAIAAISLGAVAFAQEDPFAEFKDNWTGKELPKFEMTKLDGSVLNNDYIKGQVAVIDFWATWCGPCKAAAPMLNEMYVQNREKGLKLIAASGDAAENFEGAAAIVQAYADEHDYEYTYTAFNTELIQEWGVRAFPSFLIVDRAGVVREVMVGFNKDRMEEVVASLLAEPAPEETIED